VNRDALTAEQIVGIINDQLKQIQCTQMLHRQQMSQILSGKLPLVAEINIRAQLSLWAQKVLAVNA
jgi:hypothetical protein